MCTVIAAFYPGGVHPLLIGANRDENPKRPSEEWKVRSLKNRIDTFRSPLDLKRGGTWIGTNNYFTVALTNYDIHNLKYKVSMSRGQVVMDMLLNNYQIDHCTKLVLKKYECRPFNMFVGNGSKLLYMSYDGLLLSKQYCEMGVHIITGEGYNFTTRCDNIRNILRSKMDLFIPVSIETMRSVLTFHAAGDPEDGCCIHDPEHKWETVSSSLIDYISEKDCAISYINGKPCKNHQWQSV